MRQDYVYDSPLWQIDKEFGFIHNGLLENHKIDIIGKDYKEALSICQAAGFTRFEFRGDGCPKELKTNVTTLECDYRRIHFYIDKNGIVFGTETI